MQEMYNSSFQSFWPMRIADRLQRQRRMIMEYVTPTVDLVTVRVTTRAKNATRLGTKYELQNPIAREPAVLQTK